jgi:phosphoglycolate phosphatase
VDFTIGGFGGSDSYPKAGLLEVARKRAEEKYQVRFDGSATVYIADSPRDVEAAKIAGVRSIAVASGRASSTELRAAGADAVLPDLTDPAALISIIESLS